MNSVTARVRFKEALSEEDLERKIALYTEAIELDPNFALAYQNRGRRRFYVGQFKEAERDFAKGVWLEPLNAYGVIWLYLSRARAPGGKPDAEALRADTAKMDPNKWPGPVVSMYLGKLTPETLRDTAHSNDQKTDRKHRCEANFYIGELRLLERRQADATSLFRAALETCPRSFMEYGGANAELQRLAAD